MPSVLFLCTGNSARSQLAQVLFQEMASDEFQVFSAGTHPQTVDDRVYQVLAEHGIYASGLRSKAPEELSLQSFDYVITLCDRAKDECSLYPDSKALVHWDLADPKPLSGIEPFEKTFAELDEHIRLFLKLNSQHDQARPFDSPTELFRILSDNTRLRILMLIEDEQELCVSDLTEALREIQPKISRHLAQMRAVKVLSVRRQGQMVYYRLSETMPPWVKAVLATIRTGNADFINDEKIRLKLMSQS